MVVVLVKMYMQATLDTCSKLEDDVNAAMTCRCGVSLYEDVHAAMT